MSSSTDGIVVEGTGKRRRAMPSIICAEQQMFMPSCHPSATANRDENCISLPPTS